MNDSSVLVVRGDVSEGLLDGIRGHHIIAWDIETSGLSWRHDRIGSCQVHSSDDKTVIVRFNGVTERPSNLVALLEDPSIRKIFHHAMFDLRFMAWHWRVAARNVACTKIAAKIVEPGLSSYSLKNVLSRYLGVNITKNMGSKDWFGDSLLNTQLRYAADDVAFLLPLYEELMKRSRETGRLEIMERIFDFIPTRVALDLLGTADVFKY